MELPTKPTLVLTVREKEVMDLLCQAKSREEIATELGLAVRTVAFHMTGILKKSGCKAGREFASKYLANGFDVQVTTDPRCFSNRKKEMIDEQI